MHRQRVGFQSRIDSNADCADAGPIDCSKMSLCRTDACHCEPSGCMHSPESKNALDLHRSGNELQGPIDGMGTAYLFRQ
jgi:hypothetical protein